MNCVELQHSLMEIEDGGGAEQRVHLTSCPECRALVAELNLITSSAVELRAIDEPSPRVWNCIEISLRQEGLIRPQRASRSLIPSFNTRWGFARWMVPAAAVLLLLVGVYVRQRTLPANQSLSARLQTPPAAVGDLNDDDLLQEVASQSPVMRAQYADDLRRANDYIHDAESDVQANPNDEEARRSLMEAYEQKSMLFEMAMDRSLP
jgi:hypothetical protein